MSGIATTPPNPAGDIARIGALLAAIEELACDLEDHVDGPGFNMVTAIQACVESAMRNAERAVEALPLSAGLEGGAA